jgi:ABC-type branched-subunit amino acid transport system ATPase component
MALARISNLTKGYGGVMALSKVSFDLEGGEIVGLIGPNGSGKTTLLDLFNGYLKADSGEIWFKSQSMLGMSTFQIARMGVGRTFQVSRVFRDMTVLENLLTIKKDHSAAQEVIALVGLTGLEQEFGGNLSGGQQKLLEFARALMFKSELYLMDEPLTGVTPVIVDRLIRIIDSLRKGGTTFMIVEHNFSIIERLCERCIVLHEGRKIADDVLSIARDDPNVIEAYLGPKNDLRS